MEPTPQTRREFAGAWRASAFIISASLAIFLVVVMIAQPSPDVGALMMVTTIGSAFFVVLSSVLADRFRRPVMKWALIGAIFGPVGLAVLLCCGPRKPA